MDMLPDKKVFSYLLRGSAEFNEVQRIIDYGLLTEAVHFDFKNLAQVIKAYHEQYRMPPTFEVLKEHLLEDYDSVQLVYLLEEEKCSQSEVGFYVDKIRKRYNAYLAKLLSDAANQDNSFDHEEYNKSLGRIQSKIERLYKSAVFSEGSLSQSTEDRVGRYFNIEKSPDEIAGVFLGYKELDNYTWGIKNSELLVISGASSSGKSLLMMNVAIRAWLGSNDPMKPGPYFNDGKNVIFFSLEMSKPQLENRIDSNLGNIPTNHISRGRLTQEEKERYYSVLEFCKNYNKTFYICDMPRGSRTIDIEARFDAICSEFKPDLVCVDYLGIMKPNNSRNQDWLDVGYVAEDLHEFCRSKNIPLITAAQRKARDKKAKNQSNDLEELGRSKMIGDNANIVFLIENREEEELREDMNIFISKNRDGAKGKVSLMKNFENGRIESLPDNWTEDSGNENDF